MNENERDTGILLANVARELREQLSALYMAQRRIASPEEREASPQTDRNAAYADQSRMRMTRLARNLEELSSLMRGEEAVWEVCDLVQLVSEVCEGAADLLEYRGVDLRFFCMEERHDCSVQPELIRQALYHLMSNAAKAVKAVKEAQAKGLVQVSLKFERTAHEIVLSVEDNGCGIPADELVTLFSRPHTPALPEENRRGAGLGLNICQRIAEAHGGTLAVKSKTGKGSVFTLRIPEDEGNSVRFRQADFYAPNGGTHPGLLALADALPWEAFRIADQM